MDTFSWNKYPDNRPEDAEDTYLIIDKNFYIHAVSYDVRKGKFYTMEYGETCINKFYEEYIKNEDVLYWLAFSDLPTPV